MTILATIFKKKLKEAKERLREKGYGYVKCRVCGKKIKYKRGYQIVNGVDVGRLIAIRRHYKKEHPKLFKKIIKRAIRKRKGS